MHRELYLIEIEQMCFMIGTSTSLDSLRVMADMRSIPIAQSGLRGRIIDLMSPSFISNITIEFGGGHGD